MWSGAFLRHKLPRSSTGLNNFADLARGRTIDWSDSWSEEDLADATTASLRRFEEQELEGR